MAGTGILSLALVMVLLGGLSGLATAQFPTPPPLTLDQLRWNEIQQKLGLTPDQATTLQALLSASRATMKTDVQALKAAHQSLRAAWDAADAGSIRTAFGQVQAAQTQLANDRLSTQLQILQTLGPDLYKQWRALHHRGRHGWGHGFGPGM